MSDSYREEMARYQRHERRRQVLGDPKPFCNICGIDAVEVLEAHHTFGAANSEHRTWLCRNHHAMASDRQEDLVPDLRRPDPNRSPLLKQAAMQQGAAIMLNLLAEELEARAAWNVEASADLIAEHGEDVFSAIKAEVPK